MHYLHKSQQTLNSNSTPKYCMAGWEDGRTGGTEVVIMRGSERKEIFIFHNENR